MLNDIIAKVSKFIGGWFMSYVFTICLSAFGWINITGTLGYGADKFVVPIVVSLIFWSLAFVLIEVAVFIALVFDIFGILGFLLELGLFGYLAIKVTLYLMPEGVVTFYLHPEYSEVTYIGYGAPYLIMAILLFGGKILKLLGMDEKSE